MARLPGEPSNFNQKDRAVIFTQPQQSPYDWNFRIFNIPVQVSPWFWVVSAIMGWSSVHHGFQYLALWIGCVFVSILVHELGHVLTGRLFGAQGHIILYGFGGLAVGSNHLSDRTQRIAVVFAGPAAGFIFLGAVLLVFRMADPEMVQQVLGSFYFFVLRLFGIDTGRPGAIPELSLGSDFLWNMLWINCLWGFLNLLPIWPLDGGQISRDFLGGLLAEAGVRFALILSGVVAGALALACLVLFKGQSLYLPFFFGILALGSFQALQQVQAQRRWAEEHWDDPDRHRDRWPR
jgi:Zn-dependent protease